MDALEQAHGTLARAVAAGEMRVRVDNSKAMFLYGRPGLLPRPLRAEQARRRTLGFVLLIAAPLALLWWPWWTCLALIVGGGGAMRSAQRAAGAGVTRAALANHRVMAAAIATGALRLETGSITEQVAPPQGVLPL